MRVNILRGQQQIGGSIIEISTDSTKIIFDAGINLDEGDEIKIPKIDGLFFGEKKYDAVFVSHYHQDHIGLLGEVVKDIPIYIGETAYKILNAACNYREDKIKFIPKFYYDNEKIVIGDMEITPFKCDHSAFDSYMFLIEADNKKILYTGDFRANGRTEFEELLEKLPCVNSVIIEGTTLSRNDEIENIEEEFLEDIAVRELKKHKGPAFIMMSAMNIDRLITAYNVAKKSERIFLEDVYTAAIQSATEENFFDSGGERPVRVFITGGDKQYNELLKYKDKKIGKTEISKTPFLMCIRQSMRNYLLKLSKICSFEDGILFYAMWKGYLEQPEMKEFIEFMTDKGVKLHILHTSGHADFVTIERIINKISPKTIIPVHTQNARWFSRFKDINIIYNCSYYEI